MHQRLFIKIQIPNITECSEWRSLTIHKLYANENLSITPRIKPNLLADSQNYFLNCHNHQESRHRQLPTIRQLSLKTLHGGREISSADHVTYLDQTFPKSLSDITTYRTIKLFWVLVHVIRLSCLELTYIHCYSLLWNKQFRTVLTDNM